MLQIRTNRYSRENPPRTVVIDLHNLDVPGSDKKAHQFSGPDLYAHCKRLKIPGVESFMGWQEIATRLGVYLQEEPEAAK